MWIEDSTWTRTGGGRFEGIIPASWSQGRASFGGIVAAVAVRCARVVVGPERRLRSAMVTFVGPLSAEPAEATIEVLRDGKALKQTMIRIVQEGSTRAVVVAVFGESRNTAIALAGPCRPDVAPPTELQEMPYIEGLMPAFVQHFDFRWTVPNIPFTGTGDSHAQGWFRLREDTPIDDPGLLGLFDGWPPPIWAEIAHGAAGSTVTWQVNIADEIAGYSMSDWWFYDSRAVVSLGGHCDFEARMWTPAGRLAATGRQYFAEFSAAP